MKYGIWRHENALGNSAEQVVNLSAFIRDNNDQNPIIYVETEFQFYMALCIPNVKYENVLSNDRYHIIQLSWVLHSISNVLSPTIMKLFLFLLEIYF